MYFVVCLFLLLVGAWEIHCVYHNDEQQSSKSTFSQDQFSCIDKVQRSIDIYPQAQCFPVDILCISEQPLWITFRLGFEQILHPFEPIPPPMAIRKGSTPTDGAHNAFCDYLCWKIESAKKSSLWKLWITRPVIHRGLWITFCPDFVILIRFLTIDGRVIHRIHSLMSMIIL